MISIVVPVHNDDKCIAVCLNSIINQTYKDIEIIVVDDGSSDNSGIICDSFAISDNRIRVIHTDNFGVSHARNIGIKECCGDFIAFCDSDDYYECTFCRQMLSRAVSANRMIMCGFKYTESNLVCSYSENTEDIVSKADFFKLYNTHLFNPPTNKLYSRSIIKDNGILFDETIDLGEDLIFNLRYFEHCSEALIINKSLYNYNKHENFSLSTKYREDMVQIQMRLFSELEMFRKRFEIEIDENYFTAYLQLVNRIMQNNIHKSRPYFKGMTENCRLLKKDLIIKKMKYSDFHNSGAAYLLCYKTGIYPLVRLYARLSVLKNKLHGKQRKK